MFAILGYFLNWKVDSLFVTAALTVIGFSVHDTIVIFDRIRENLKGKGGRDDFGDLVNKSINETFARSINTSLTVMLTLLALLIFAGPVIRPLNAALLIGIFSGTFSSIFNAAPLVYDWQRRFGKAGDLHPATPGGGATTPRPAPRPATPSRPVTPAPRSMANGDGVRAGDRPSGESGTTDTTPRPSLPPGPRPRKRRM
jgi:hypothetical protein